MASRRRRSSSNQNSRAIEKNTTAVSARQVKPRRSKADEVRSGKSARPKNHFDRYTAMARAAAANGNTIDAENYYQHAEHYYRLMKQQAA